MKYKIYINISIFFIASVIGAISTVTAQAPGTSYGQVLSTGIQDISAIAALFGTDMCADHLLNVVNRGYLYGAVTAISMFGSLGSVKAALYVVLPSRWLHNIGMINAGPLLTKFNAQNAKPLLYQISVAAES